MARDTNHRIEVDLGSPEFNKLLEEAKFMVQRSKIGARHIIKQRV